MKTIYKYQIAIQDSQILYMPKDAHVLHLDIDQATNCPAVWAYLDTEQPMVPRLIQVVCTGMPLPDEVECHLGTIQAGGCVWHFFDASA